jgi:hypothetical protein
MERDLGYTLTWPVSPSTGLGGASYVCVPAQSMFGKMLAATGGGYSPKGTAGFFLRVGLFANGVLPASQQHLKFNGQIWRILDMDNSADGAFIFLDCAVKDRGA